MARRNQSMGVCAYCGRELASRGMTRHLTACPSRKEVVAGADKARGRDTKLYHLIVRDHSDSDFWLHLEVNGLATLHDLDRYLRFIWLECCGHLSQFSVGGWSGDEIPLGRKVGRVFEPGLQLTHIYDFGDSSVTLLRTYKVRVGKPTTPNPVTLMARNNAPERRCIDCGQPATLLCIECIWEHNSSGTLCERHGEAHPHEDDGDPLIIGNSPRMGLCGYEGPAEPPY